MQELWHKHIWKITFVICLPLISAWAFADEIVGYTEHGVPVYESELQTKPTEVTKRIKIPLQRIRTYESIDFSTLIVHVRSKGKDKSYELKTAGCFDIDWAHQISFETFSSMYIRVGDRIRYQSLTPSWRYSGNYCVITKITEVIIEDNDVR